MNFFRKHRWGVVTTVYWMLLLYVVAALFWWFIALENQNRNISAIRLNELRVKDHPLYYEWASEIEDTRKRKTAQYIGEGVTFLAIILVGAVYVFRATRRQFKLSQQQQNFMMAITHELKTPIAVTRLNLETLQKRKLDEEKQQKLITNTLQEANRLNTLCNNILLAAQLDAGYVSAKQEINLTDLVEGAVDEFRNRFPQRQLAEDIQETVYINGEALLLQMLVNNLIDNALKYSPKDSPVSIALAEEQGKIKLTVGNEGQSIPAGEKKKIFDKFYRVGDENTRKTKGTGLGLYLCSKIVQSHNGYISVTDNTWGGSNFVVSLK